MVYACVCMYAYVRRVQCVSVYMRNAPVCMSTFMCACACAYMRMYGIITASELPQWCEAIEVKTILTAGYRTVVTVSVSLDVCLL